MQDVVSWDGDGWRLSVNGLFSDKLNLIPSELSERIANYVQAEEEDEDIRIVLEGELSTIWRANFAKIHSESGSQGDSSGLEKWRK